MADSRWLGSRVIEMPSAATSRPISSRASSRTPPQAMPAGFLGLAGLAGLGAGAGFVVTVSTAAPAAAVSAAGVADAAEADSTSAACVPAPPPFSVTSKTAVLFHRPENTPWAMPCDRAMPASAAPQTSFCSQRTRRMYISGPISALKKKKAISGIMNSRMGRLNRWGAAMMPMLHAMAASANSRCRASPIHENQPVMKW